MPSEFDPVGLSAELMSCTACYVGELVAELWPQLPPRGWAGPAAIERPSVLIASLNPGHPLQLAKRYRDESWNERALLERHGLLARPQVEGECVVTRRTTAVSREAAADVLALCWRSYTAPTRGKDHQFHRRSVAYAKACSWLLGVDPVEWRRRTWFTDVVKCSTIRESGAGLPDRAIANCQTHLVREMKAVQPSLVAMLGKDRRAFDAVKSACVAAGISAPILRLLHPSQRRERSPDEWAIDFPCTSFGKEEPAFLAFFRSIWDQPGQP